MRNTPIYPSYKYTNPQDYYGYNTNYYNSTFGPCEYYRIVQYPFRNENESIQFYYKNNYFFQNYDPTKLSNQSSDSYNKIVQPISSLKGMMNGHNSHGLELIQTKQPIKALPGAFCSSKGSVAPESQASQSTQILNGNSKGIHKITERQSSKNKINFETNNNWKESLKDHSKDNTADAIKVNSLISNDKNITIQIKEVLKRELKEIIDVKDKSVDIKLLSLHLIKSIISHSYHDLQDVF